MEEIRISAGGVVLNPDGEVLVVSQNGNSWSLPKGGVERGEDLHAAAKREIYEESGIDKLEFVRDLGHYERSKISRDGDGEDALSLKHLHFFLYTTTQTALKPIDPNNPEARWVAKDDVEKLLTHPKDKEFFAAIKSQI